VFGFLGDRNLRDGAFVVVAFVVAAEDFFVEGEPVLEGVAGGADAEDGFCRCRSIF